MDGWKDGRMEGWRGREGGREGEVVVDGRGECGLVGWVLGLALHSHSDSISLTITSLVLHPPIPPSSPSLPPSSSPSPSTLTLTHSLSLHALAACLWSDEVVGWAWAEWVHGWLCCIRLLGHSLHGSLLGRWWGWVCVWLGWCVCVVSVWLVVCVCGVHSVGLG